MGFRLVPKSVTLNDLEWCRPNGRYFALFQRNRAHYVKVVEDIGKLSATEM